SFVIAGSAETREGGGSHSERTIRRGESSPEAMREKARYVLGEMERRLAVLGLGWADTTATQFYTVRDLYPFLADEIVRRGAGRWGRGGRGMARARRCKSSNSRWIAAPSVGKASCEVGPRRASRDLGRVLIKSRLPANRWLMSALPPKNGPIADASVGPLCAKSCHMQCSKLVSLFDHLVGEREQIVRNFDSECLRGPEIDHHLEFGRLQNRQVTGLCTIENLRGVDAILAIAIGNIDAVAQQSARYSILAKLVNGGQALLCREPDDPIAPHVKI